MAWKVKVGARSQGSLSLNKAESVRNATEFLALGKRENECGSSVRGRTQSIRTERGHLGSLSVTFSWAPSLPPLSRSHPAPPTSHHRYKDPENCDCRVLRLVPRKNLSPNAINVGSVPGWGRSPEEAVATHSSILAWRISWTEEPGGLQAMGSQRFRHD